MQPAPNPYQAPVRTPPGQADFGPVVSEHHVGGKRYWSLFGLILFLGLGALAGFIALLASDELAGALLCAFAILGLVLLLVVMSGVRVTVFTHGIERRGRFGSKRLGWDQLESYTLEVIDPSRSAAGVGGLVAMLVIRLLTSNQIKPQAVNLRGRNGEKVTIPNQLRDYDALLASLVPYLTERLAARVHYDLSRGVGVGFGKRLALDPQAGIVFTGLLGGKQNLPFHEVESIGFERALLAIRRRGEPKPWQTVAIAAVPNVGVLQRIVAQASPARHAPPPGNQYGWAR